MSDQETKDKRSKRFHKTENVIHKQQDIALSHSGTDLEFQKKIRDEGGRFAKHHAMDCGDSNCHMCGNPRKIYKELTKQEKSFAQTEGWVEE